MRIPLTCPVTLQRTAGDPHTHAHRAEQPIFLDGTYDVSPGAPNANVEGGDPVGDVVAIIGPRTTLASARDPERVLNRVKHEQTRSKPLRSYNPLWKFFTVYRKDSLPGMAVCKLCEANGGFAVAEVRLRPRTTSKYPFEETSRHQEERASQGL